MKHMFPLLATPEESSKIAEHIGVCGLPTLEDAYRLGGEYSDCIFGEQSDGILRRSGGLASVFVLGYVSGVRAAKAKQRQKGGIQLDAPAEG